MMRILSRLAIGLIAVGISAGSASAQPAGIPDPIMDPGNKGNMWVYGDMSVGNQAGNADYIKLGLLFPYVKALALYKCPADTRSALNANSMASPLSVRSGRGRAPGAGRLWRRASSVSTVRR